MNRAQRRHEKFNTENRVMTFSPVKRKRKTEDSHIDWLWRKVQNGFKLEFEIPDPKREGHFKKTMSHRTLAKLISLQEASK